MEENERLEALEENLQQKFKEANMKAKTPMSPEEVEGIVKEVVASLAGDVTASDLKFYSELEDLASYIRHAKEEIAEIRPKEISDSHIPTATDELDAVVGATEDATNKIMDVCDTIMELAPKCNEEVSAELMNCTTRVYEACNFQDITGQRITKVVQTLKYIDVKVGALLQALGEEMGRDPSDLPDLHGADVDAKLLNGPQLDQNAIDQDEIDKLMSS